MNEWAAKVILCWNYGDWSFDDPDWVKEITEFICEYPNESSLYSGTSIAKPPKGWCGEFALARQRKLDGVEK